MIRQPSRYTRTDTRFPDTTLFRSLPRLHEGVNEEWINDKTRHACDGLSRQRLDRPYLRNGAGRLEAVSWSVAFKAIAERLKGVPGERVAAIPGARCDAEYHTEESGVGDRCVSTRESPGAPSHNKK